METCRKAPERREALRAEAAEPRSENMAEVILKNIKKVYPDCVTIFINPPSLEELKKRLIGRGSETPDSLKKRLDEIEFERKSIPYYDFVVINDVAEDCADKIVNYLEQRRSQIK
mgnify:CR=1 FL=1